MSRLVLWSALVLSLAAVGAVVLAEDPRGKAARPLDLPAFGVGGDEEDEDAPESITFYGSEYEGDGFFWCLDKSCSMGWAGELETLKLEATQAIQQLSTKADFGLNAYSSNVVTWSSSPKRANSGNKAAAIAWIQGLQPEGWTCLAPAGVQVVQMAHQSSKRRCQILILGDGQPWCDGVDTGPQCLSDITAANYDNIPVNTLYISATTEGIPFFQQLASSNGGTFTLVD